MHTSIQGSKTIENEGNVVAFSWQRLFSEKIKTSDEPLVRCELSLWGLFCGK